MVATTRRSGAASLAPSAAPSPPAEAARRAQPEERAGLGAGAIVELQRIFVEDDCVLADRLTDRVAEIFRRDPVAGRFCLFGKRGPPGRVAFRKRRAALRDAGIAARDPLGQ